MANVRPYPKVDEVFELTLDGDAPENQPLEMVRRDNCNNPEEWRHRGRVVNGRHIRRFKLVRIGYHGSFRDMRREIDSLGRVPEGQWREAFKAAYPHSGYGTVGIADDSWLDPDDNASFPYIYDGISRFGFPSYKFSTNCVWLVEVQDKEK
jgi:hypothetical protein